MAVWAGATVDADSCVRAHYCHRTRDVRGCAVITKTARSPEPLALSSGRAYAQRASKARVSYRSAARVATGSGTAAGLVYRRTHPRYPCVPVRQRRRELDASDWPVGTHGARPRINVGLLYLILHTDSVPIRSQTRGLIVALCAPETETCR